MLLCKFIIKLFCSVERGQRSGSTPGPDCPYNSELAEGHFYSATFSSAALKLNSPLSDSLSCPSRARHRQARGARDRAAARAGRPAGTGLAGLAAVRGRGRHRHYLQPRAQDGQHLLHEHRLRPVREEPLSRPAHQHHQEQPGHVHTGPGERALSFVT